MHIIPGLHMGGAEMMLCRLLGSMTGEALEQRVISLGGGGPVGEQMKAQGITVDALGGKGRLAAGRVTLAATRMARAYRPDIIQGWMYDGNLAAWWAARRCGSRLAWNVRHSVADIMNEPAGLRLAIRLCALLSAGPDVIVYNSYTTAEQHQVLGFAADKSRVLPNGFDTTVFKPDPDARGNIRASLGIGETAFLVGKIARYHPLKDHCGFIRAAGQVSEAVPEARFLLAGAGVDNDNEVLINVAEQTGIRSRIIFLGERTDTPALNAALDVAVSASLGEGFSNVIGEAMACGVPSVVTDVGDGRELVGETGRTVPPGEPDALATAVLDLHRLGREGRLQLGKAARERVISRYSLPEIAGRYRDLYEALR